MSTKKEKAPAEPTPNTKKGDHYSMTQDLKQMPRVADAIAIGQLDPAQVPASLDDINGMDPTQRLLFFDAIYPPELIDVLSEQIKNGGQLSEDDNALIGKMPLSMLERFPIEIQSTFTSKYKDALFVAIEGIDNNMQSVIEGFKKILSSFEDDICKKAGISKDEYNELMPKLREDIKTHPDKYAEYDFNDSEYIILADVLKKFQDELITGNVHKYKPSSGLLLALDKVSQEIVSISGKHGNKVSRSISVNTKKDPNINTYLTIAFPLIEQNPAANLPANISDFDMSVHFAAASIFVDGNRHTSLTKIYERMGYKGKPSPKHLADIAESLTNQSITLVSIDNSEEARRYNYPSFIVKDRNMLYIKKDIEFQFGGHITDSAIEILDMPILMQYAIAHNQIERIPQKVLQTGSKTKTTIAIEMYLLRRIAWLKKGKMDRKILYETFFERTRIDHSTAKATFRVKLHIHRILTHYVTCDHILGFRLLDDGILLETNDKHIEEDKNLPPTYDEIRCKEEMKKKAKS